MIHKTILRLLTICFIVTGCGNKLTSEIIKAKFEDNFGTSIKLSLTADSLYTLVEKKAFDTIANIYTGKYKLQNDKLYFPDEIPLLKTKEAILKNNSIDFYGGVKFLIIETALKIPSKINFSEHPDISVFEFNPDHLKHIFDKNVKSYDLDEKDVEEIIRIFNACPSREGILKDKPYNKQLVAVINESGEKEVWVNCSCELSTDFQYRLIDVSDGGPCYMNMKINLTTHQCYDVQFNRRA